VPTIKLTSEYQLDTIRPVASIGGGSSPPGFASNVDTLEPAAGWADSTYWVYPGMSEQNNPNAFFKNGGEGNRLQTQYYTDPDGVARRAMGAYVPTGSGNTDPPATTTTGLPLASNPTPAASRPILLNRPFRNVGELAYVYRDTPWKNIDFFTPESGDTGLLDAFCINADDRPDAMVAGKVNLNTRQVPVLQAILAGATRDELNATTLPPTEAGSANAMAAMLVTRTTGTAPNQGPLINLGDLVGRYVEGYSNIWGQPYDGFSNDLAPPTSTSANDIIQRFRESSIRALAQVGQTRVWNLLIDVVAQEGRYPLSATALDQFVVEGEQRYWVHVAIDRMTGEVIDRQIEIVKE